MKAYNAITVVCVLIMLVTGIGSAYAYYNSTLVDNETANVTNNYGTVTMSESAGVYTLTYQDTTSDSVYLTMEVSGLSSDYPPGTIVDLWLGSVDAISEFGSTYSATVDGSTLTSLSRQLSRDGSLFTDGDAAFTVTCSAGTVSVSKGGAPLSVYAGMFHDGSAYYTVDASGDTVNSVSRMLPIDGSAGRYVFDDGGYRYVISCSAGHVTAASKCIVISSSVNAQGVATFSTWTVGLTQKQWQDTVALYHGAEAADLGDYEIVAKFYSTGGLS